MKRNNEWRKKLAKLARMNPRINERLSEVEDTGLYEVWVRDKRKIWLGILRGYELQYLVVSTYLHRSNPTSAPKWELEWEPLYT